MLRLTLKVQTDRYLGDSKVTEKRVLAELFNSSGDNMHFFGYDELREAGKLLIDAAEDFKELEQDYANVKTYVSED